MLIHGLLYSRRAQPQETKPSQSLCQRQSPRQSREHLHLKMLVGYNNEAVKQESRKISLPERGDSYSSFGSFFGSFLGSFLGSFFTPLAGLETNFGSFTSSSLSSFLVALAFFLALPPEAPAGLRLTGVVGVLSSPASDLAAASLEELTPLALSIRSYLFWLLRSNNELLDI